MRDKLRRLLRDADPADLTDDASIEDFLDQSAHAKFYGGNTSCVEVQCDDETFIFDAGSGMRGLAETMLADGRSKDHPIHILFTHFHWDHLCGLPFFVPVYLPGRELDIRSWRDDTERLLKIQMSDAFFPVKWDGLPSKIMCSQLMPEQANQVGGGVVTLKKLQHPDGCYGYRLTRGGRSVCYLTDTEVSQNPELLSAGYAEFVEGADLVLVDAMYGFLDYHEHYNYGHSSIFTWIDFFRDSKIGELVVFHHDPAADDIALGKLADAAQRYRELVAPEAAWSLSVAYEGQTWDLAES
ncbi:MAG: MBL fold metallo-hydrolase [Planctomycetota bacterium]|jgi:phosphoribosyl 1,2-cyclic phosphodiesterase|nr:MBL fold metallo-hydrolase [Planctomycetota bacterium]